jgi:hypothetical protein
LVPVCESGTPPGEATIPHGGLDAFSVPVEQRDDPRLVVEPVGGDHAVTDPQPDLTRVAAPVPVAFVVGQVLGHRGLVRSMPMSITRTSGPEAARYRIGPARVAA